MSRNADSAHALVRADRPRIRKVRPRGQRAFFKWLDEATPRFKIPIVIQKRTDRVIEFTFQGVPPVLRGTLIFDRFYLRSSLGKRRLTVQKSGSGEIVIAVEWDGQFWDALLWEDACPVKSANGYICDDCLPEYVRNFSSREELWRDHLFEPLLEWVNTDLAGAQALGFYQTCDKGSTWAKFLRDENDPEIDCLVKKVFSATLP